MLNGIKNFIYQHEENQIMGRKGFKNNKPQLLIYAHYYFPDVASTGQILKELAEGMSDKFHITVICVVPSYRGIIEHKYKNQKSVNNCLSGYLARRQMRQPGFFRSLFLHDKELLS